MPALDPAADRAAPGLGARAPTEPKRGDNLRRMPRRHVLMLVLAAEALWFGFSNAGSYRPRPVVTVDPPGVVGHVIT